MAIVNEKMTAIANEIRELSGTTGTMGLDAMAGYVSDANDAIDSQENLIAQISAALEGKAAGAEPVLQEKTVSPSTSQQNVIPDSGYDGLSKVTVSAMPAGSVANPSISVDSSGLITATAAVNAGYVDGTDKTGTKQLTVQATQTITPGASNKTIASGQYLTGTQTIKGDANLVAANIAKGVSIFNVTGTHEGGEDVSTETAEYTELLTDLETAIDALPDAGSSSGGGSLETCTVDVQAEHLFTSVIYTTGNGTFETVDCQDQRTFSLNVCKNTILYGYGDPIEGSLTISGDSLLLLRRKAAEIYHYVFSIKGDCEINLEVLEDPF